MFPPAIYILFPRRNGAMDSMSLVRQYISLWLSVAEVK